MKILKRIFWGFVIFLAITYALPATLLQIPFFQEKISHQIASYLNRKLHTEVQIRQIELGFFNRLILRDVYMEDLSGDVLFRAKRVAAGFEFIPLLQKKWRFNSIQMFTFQFNLSKETDGSPSNIQYIIDAFEKKDTIATDSEIDLRIKNLSLQKGSFSYRVKDKEDTSGKFNPKQLLFHSISSKIQIHDFNNQKLTLALQFNKLSFKEQSGLQIKNATFNLMANEKTAKVDQLVVELEKSSLLFTDINANYQLYATDKSKEEPLTFQFKLKNSTIYPIDLSAFLPAFSHFDDKVNLEGDFEGYEHDFRIKNFYFRYYNQIMINANADLQNIFYSNPDIFYIKGNISNSFFSPEGIERIINNLSQQSFELPKQVKQLKTIRFEGDLNGSFNDLAAWGVLNTGVGNVKIDLALGKNETRFIKGQIASESLNLEKLLNDNDYGEMAFNILLDAKQNPDKKFSGSIDANLSTFVYKGYVYQNLGAAGEFTPTSFQGQLNLNSPEGRISGEGLWAFEGDNSKFDFRAKVSDLQLNKLNLTKKYKNPVLSFELNANLTGDKPDNFAGIVSLNNLHFETEKGAYSLKSFQMASTPSPQEKRIRIDSEILNGDIWGDFSFEAIIPALKQTFANYLPSLVKINPEYAVGDNADFSIRLKLEDLTDFSKIFELPFSLHGQTDISGKYGENSLRLDFKSPHAIIGGSRIDSLQLLCYNSEKNIQADISGINLQKKGNRIRFDINMNAADDKLNTILHWGNGSSNYMGDLKLTTQILKHTDSSSARIETDIRQTDLVFNDSIWTLYPATVVVESSNIHIDHLQLAHKDQFLKINGAISHNPEEELRIDLNRMNLDYIFQSLAIQALEFGGMATGFVTAQDIFKTRKMETNLDVTDFSFNATNFGHLDLIGTWDDINQGILMRGKTVKSDSSFINIDGIIYPVSEDISINFDAKNADARFLRKYLDKVVQDLTGNLSGRLRLFGDLNDPTVEGDVFVRNCRFGIRYLNTFYTFTDSVKCLPDMISINNVPIYDERGNKAIASGFVKHDLFQNFNFSGNISYSNFMIFNATKSLNPMFYGTTFGNGTVSLYGTEDVINIDVTAQNTENTKMTLNFMGESDVEDYDFIRFVSVKKPVVEQQKKSALVLPPTPSGSGAEIRFNLMLDATPNATIDVIMDPTSGDKISGYGKGSLQIQYGTKTPLKVFGNYVIEHGKYNFSFQQLFFRNFDIQDGSSIAFRGDPYTAEMNINANYTVNANLEDLDPQLTERSARASIPVSCILRLTGHLDRPAIAFDMYLPGSTEELNRQVKAYIRTDDMMSRQIVYLLVLNRFYTPPENMRGGDANTNTNANLSYLTSTLSAKVSDMLGLLSDKFRLGTVFHQSNVGEQTSTEFELLLSSQLLNNRLIINGNFGYTNNPYLDNNENRLPLIGDFDLEYKLTKSGDIRLKGFNHYNFRNYYSITPEMTQGIGILFRKDFNHWLDLFKKKKE